ncbi:MAG TPA: hypothetical protein VKG26_14755 [Bacteroidia bacterium]|nr:hypothetical protein [Bacteroidia bacterium]
MLKLNWAAYIGNSSAWVICITSGGYAMATTYYLITDDEDIAEEIRNPGRKSENFKNFKIKYLAGTLKTGAFY